MPRAVLLNDTRVDRHHGCDRVFAAISRHCRASSIDIIATSPAHADWQVNHEFLRSFESADLVVVNGEGTIHDDLPAGERLLQAGRYAKAINIPAVLINCTWANNGPYLHDLAASFSLVAVRERESARQLERSVSQIMVVPDLSLDGLAWYEGPRAGIGIGDSVVRQKALTLRQLKRDINARYIPMQYPLRGPMGAARYIREFQSRKDLSSPLQALRYLACRLEQWKCATQDHQSYFTLIERLELFITGRFHGVCLALGLGTPVLALASNTNKIHSMLDDAGLKNRVVQPSGLTEHPIGQWGQWRDNEAEALREYLENARTARASLFDRLRELASS